MLSMMETQLLYNTTNNNTLKIFNAIFICLFFMVYSLKSKAQKISSQRIDLDSNSFFLEKTILGNYKYFNVDILNNIYVIDKQNRLKKINENGDSVSVFNNIIQYGIPDFIDVSNPFKILVYYQRFATIATLDRWLNLRNQVNLKSKNIISTHAMAASYDNNIWIFDEQNFKIKKCNDQMEMILESIDLNLLTEKTPKPTLIVSTEKNVYLYDENEGFYIFDAYGNYKTHLPLLHWKNISVNNNTIYGFLNESLFSYSLESLTLNEYNLPVNISSFNSIRVVNGRLYLLKKEGIQIFRIE